MYCLYLTNLLLSLLSSWSVSSLLLLLCCLLIRLPMSLHHLIIVIIILIIIVIISLYQSITVTSCHLIIVTHHYLKIIIILNIDHRQLMKMIIVMTTAGVNVNCWTRHTLPSHCQQFARDSAVSGKVSQDHCTDVHNWFIHTGPNIILSLLHEDNTTCLRDNTACLTVLQTIRLHDSQIKRLKMINWFTLLLLSFTRIFLLLPTSCVQ